MAGKQLGIDNATRWNSWYLLLKAAIEHKRHLALFFDEYSSDLSSDHLTSTDWEVITHSARFLEPFYHATLQLQGHSASLEDVLINFEVLLKHYEDSKQSFAKNSHLVRCIEMGWVVLEKYYARSESSAVYALALLLHLSRRLAHIRRFWRDEWWNSAKSSIFETWARYRDTTPLEQAESVPQATKSHFDSIKAAMDVTSGCADDGDDLDRFINGRPVSIRITALEWWSVHGFEYPQLRRLAQDIFSIPPMSDEPERVFSSTRRIISWDRARLNDDTLQQLQCIKHWKQNGHISHVLLEE